MPRTTTLECPGCPPIRALTFDVLGLVKVIEACSNQGGIPKVVDRWGEPDASKSVMAASIDDYESNPLLAVARKNGLIEVINPLNGDICVSISNANGKGLQPKDSSIIGLHLFKKHRQDSSSRSCRFLTCTTKGDASICSVELSKLPQDSLQTDSLKTWNVSGAGDIFCSKVDGSENYALFGGKGIEVNVWDLDQHTKIWNAKSPAKSSLGIFTPTWFTSATFLNKDDHRKFAAGTNNHQVRLYDISAQRRPVISFDFRESPIKAVAEDLDGHTIYIGNGSGDLASVDIRTGKLLGCFLGKCSGSIKSIVRHPEYPVIASCGLDSYLRFWDVTTRQLLSAVFLKQNLTNVVFDSHFCSKDATDSAVDFSEHGTRDTLSTEIKKKLQSRSGNEELNRNKKGKKDVNVIINDALDSNDVQDGDEVMRPIKKKKSEKKSGARI